MRSTVSNNVCLNLSAIKLRSVSCSKNYKTTEILQDHFLEATGVQRGCTLLEEYCEHYIDRIGPLILSCRTCHDDFCNGSDRMQSFFWLCVVGVVSRSLL